MLGVGTVIEIGVIYQLTMNKWLKEYGFISGTIALAISAFAYFNAYIYEIAFCNYFGIPHDLIIINWPRFLINIPLTVIIFVPIVIAWWSKKWFWSGFILTFIVTWCLLWFYHVLLYSSTWQWSLLAVPSVLIILFVYSWLAFYPQILPQIIKSWLEAHPKVQLWIEALFKKKSRLKSTKTKFVLFIASIALIVCYAHYSRHQTIPISVTIGVLVPIAIIIFCKLRVRIEVLLVKLVTRLVRPLMKPVIILALLMIPPFYLYLAGKSEAQSGSYYQLQSSQSLSVINVSISEVGTDNQSLQNIPEQTLVLLRIYGDNAICTPWYECEDDQGNCVNNSTQDFVIYSLKDITITSKQVDRLHPTKNISCNEPCD